MQTETPQHSNYVRRKRLCVFSAIIAVFVLVSLLVWYSWASQAVLKISNWKTGEVYIEVPVKIGDTLFFGWMHSLEKIPWNEYYHIAPDHTLVLDSISYPAFGAGIPENKGKVCRIENGMIYFEEIGQVFEEFIWINSHYAVRDIKLNNKLVTRGELLPEHTRLRLAIERRKLL